MDVDWSGEIIHLMPQEKWRTSASHYLWNFTLTKGLQIIVRASCRYAQERKRTAANNCVYANCVQTAPGVDRGYITAAGCSASKLRHLFPVFLWLIYSAMVERG